MIQGEKVISNERFQPRIHLATLALVSFIISFAVARIFTYVYPSIVLVSGGVHIHHFWFGILLISIGGWLGINYNLKEIDMIAAIIYGVGGELIADEVGLLLTFGNYYSELTWTFLVILFSFASIVFFVRKYHDSIFDELHEFVSSKVSLYVGVFLVAISAAFILETSTFLIVVASAVSTTVGVLIILAFLIHRARRSIN